MQAAVWAAAEALVGAGFRLQGRDAATGLDCVGVIVAAYAAAGVRLDAIDDYALRGFGLRRAEAALTAAGFGQAKGMIVVGEVGLFALPARQLHLALLAPGRVIHADAGLRRVVIAPASRLPEAASRWRWNCGGNCKG
ncbi:MAG: peptidoglycan endopeptidase [Sphingopyxis sp.]|nr:peptidoglycan endopeptidase [Sphingopyxis sp.]